MYDSAQEALKQELAKKAEQVVVEKVEKIDLPLVEDEKLDLNQKISMVLQIVTVGLLITILLFK